MISDKKKIIDNYKRINELKVNLRKSDYQAIKYAEGELATEEYAETLAQRRAWRAEINALEAEIETLKSGSEAL